MEHNKGKIKLLSKRGTECPYCGVQSSLEPKLVNRCDHLIAVLENRGFDPSIWYLREKFQEILEEEGYSPKVLIDWLEMKKFTDNKLIVSGKPIQNSQRNFDEDDIDAFFDELMCNHVMDERKGEKVPIVFYYSESREGALIRFREHVYNLPYKNFTMPLSEMYVLEYSMGKYEDWHKLKTKKEIRPKVDTGGKLCLKVSMTEDGPVLEGFPTNILFELLERYHEKKLIKEGDFREIKEKWPSLDENGKRILGARYYHDDKMLDTETEKWLLYRIIEQVGTGSEFSQMYQLWPEDFFRNGVFEEFVSSNICEERPKYDYPEFSNLSNWSRLRRHLQRPSMIRSDSRISDFVTTIRKFLEESINNLFKKIRGLSDKPVSFWKKLQTLRDQGLIKTRDEMGYIWNTCNSFLHPGPPRELDVSTVLKFLNKMVLDDLAGAFEKTKKIKPMQNPTRR